MAVDNRQPSERTSRWSGNSTATRRRCAGSVSELPRQAAAGSSARPGRTAHCDGGDGTSRHGEPQLFLELPSQRARNLGLRFGSCGSGSSCRTSAGASAMTARPWTATRRGRPIARPGRLPTPAGEAWDDRREGRRSLEEGEVVVRLWSARRRPLRNPGDFRHCLRVPVRGQGIGRRQAARLRRWRSAATTSARTGGTAKAKPWDRFCPLIGDRAAGREERSAFRHFSAVFASEAEVDTLCTERNPARRLRPLRQPIRQGRR